jgi:hypothetical protein
MFRFFWFDLEGPHKQHGQPKIIESRVGANVVFGANPHFLRGFKAPLDHPTTADSAKE